VSHQTAEERCTCRWFGDPQCTAHFRPGTTGQPERASTGTGDSGSNAGSTPAPGSRPLPAGEHPHGPPFTVERYGTFGQSVIAERDWLLEEVERLRRALVAAETALGLHRDVGTPAKCPTCGGFGTISASAGTMIPIPCPTCVGARTRS
jgi:hypothetical protein